MTKLKTAATAALLIIASGAAEADNRGIEHCSDWAFLGQIAMKMRQEGTPIKRAIESTYTALVDIDGPMSLKEVLPDMVAFAYRHQLESTDRLAEVAAIRFSERLFVGCMAHMGDD